VKAFVASTKDYGTLRRFLDPVRFSSSESWQVSASNGLDIIFAALDESLEENRMMRSRLDMIEAALRGMAPTLL